MRRDRPHAGRADGRHRTLDSALAVPGADGTLAPRHQPGPGPEGAGVARPSGSGRLPTVDDPKYGRRTGPATAADLPDRHRPRPHRHHGARHRTARAAGRPPAARTGPPAARRSGERADVADLHPRAARPLLWPRGPSTGGRHRRSRRLRGQSPRWTSLCAHRPGAAHRLYLRPARPDLDATGRPPAAPGSPSWSPCGPRRCGCCDPDSDGSPTAGHSTNSRCTCSMGAGPCARRRDRLRLACPDVSVVCDAASPGGRAAPCAAGPPRRSTRGSMPVARESRIAGVGVRPGYGRSARSRGSGAGSICGHQLSPNRPTRRSTGSAWPPNQVGMGRWTGDGCRRPPRRGASGPRRRRPARSATHAATRPLPAPAPAIVG